MECGFVFFFLLLRQRLTPWTSYFVCGGIIQLCTYFLEKNTVFLTKPHGDSVLRIQSEFDVPKYTITVTHVSPAGGLVRRYRHHAPDVQYTRSWPVNELFDERGALDKERLTRDLNNLLKFERGQ